MKYASNVLIILYSIILSQSQAQQITFTDVAGLMNIDHPFSYIRGSVSFCDFDGDGNDDLSFSSIQDEPIYIYRNNVSQFINITSQIGFIDASRTMNLLWCDYDNDGDKDLFAAVDNFCDYSRLYRNDGYNNFVDITVESGIGTNPSSSNAACWGDYNNDGWLDLYVTHSSEYEHNYLFKNNMDGTFTDVTETAQVADTIGGSERYRLPLAVVFFDYSNDGWQDIYIANDHFTGNTLFKNNADGTFEDVTEQSNSDSSGFMMGIAVGDYDNNGFLDLYLSNDPFGNHFLKNNGNGTFNEVVEELGLSVNKSCWGTNFFDYDNDTDLDLYVCAAAGPDNGINEFFENNGDGTFAKLFGIGLDEDYKSFGMAVGDYNNDGFYDISVNNQQTLPNLFRNSGGSNNWVKLKLTGITCNRDSVGSWIEAYINNKKIVRQTNCGISYMSQNSSDLIIGAGTAKFIDSIRITWAGSGTIDVLKNIAVNQTITVEEGETTITAVAEENLSISGFYLEQNYPNPFNPNTKIKFSLEKDSRVTLMVYNLLGQEIITLNKSFLPAGSHDIDFTAVSNTGRLNSGVYFYRIEVAGLNGTHFSSVKKMVLTK